MACRGRKANLTRGREARSGAQGLMQIMPGTAKLIAKQYRMPYEPAKLMGDPAYNVKLGAAHLGDLIADYNGSYVLTLVAYNAGPTAGARMGCGIWRSARRQGRPH